MFLAKWVDSVAAKGVYKGNYKGLKSSSFKRDPEKGYYKGSIRVLNIRAVIIRRGVAGSQGLQQGFRA